jgi:hypothetical protein
MDTPNHIVRGLLWFGGGLIVTLISYSAVRTHGGVYLVASGAIFWGFLEFVYGLFLLILPSVSSSSPGPIKTAPSPINAPKRWYPLVQLIQPSPREPAAHYLSPEQQTRWDALVKYDPEIECTAEQLRPYGTNWINKLGHEFFALNEDRQYLPRIVDTLLKAAKQETEDLIKRAEDEKAERWAARFMQLHSGETCTKECLDVLRLAEANGYVLATESSGSITATGPTGKSYLRSNYDISEFGKWLKKSLTAEDKAKIAKRVLDTEFVEDAQSLIQVLGGKISLMQVPGKLLPKEVFVLTVGNNHQQFESEYEMTRWIMKEIAPAVIAKAAAKS